MKVNSALLVAMAAIGGFGGGFGLPPGPDRIERDPRLTPLVNVTDKQRRADEKAERRRLRNLKIAGGA